MRLLTLFSSPVFGLALALGAVCLPALERVSGANATLETLAGTRSAALGGAALALSSDLPALSSNPQQLADLQYSELAFAHVSYYEGTAYDYAAMGWPLGLAGSAGLAVSRFGATGIPLISASEPLPEGGNYNTFSISDWVITGAWGRHFGKLAVGLSAHGLKRELDQTGWGFRADAGLRYPVFSRLEASALLQGWTSSAARWESGYSEYSPPELKLALHGQEPFPYFYGTAHLYWQGAGVFHHENRDLVWDGDLFDTTSTSVSTDNGTLWQTPLDWLADGSMGLEFVTEFGIALRAGLAQISEPSSWTAGAGIQPFPWFQADYAYQSHPVLSGVHRVAISFSPGLYLHPAPVKKAAQQAVPAANPVDSATAPATPPVPEVHAPTAQTPAQPASPSAQPSSPEEDMGGTYWEE